MEAERVPNNSKSLRASAADYIIKNRDKIKTTWRSKAFEKNPEPEGDQFPVIANSLGIFLDELAQILRQSDPFPERLSEHAMSKIYGGEKAIVERYPLSRLLWEFALVRESVIEELQSAMTLDPEVHVLIDKTIDVAMSLAATEFEKVQKAQLESTLAKVEASNRDLDEFAMIAAHDLNSPLATVTGFLDLLSESIPENSPPEVTEYLQHTEKALTRMRGLVTSLLQYARLENSKTGFQKVSLSEVLQATLQNLGYLIEQTRAKIEYEPLPVVFGDPNLLSLVFQNLISNSIKYRGATDPEIMISAMGTDPQSWIISIKDNGIGFETKDTEEIFKLYKRLKKSEQPGAGIGLATTRKIIELHGGTIWAESQPGIGSTFFFKLPKNP